MLDGAIPLKFGIFFYSYESLEGICGFWSSTKSVTWEKPWWYKNYNNWTRSNQPLTNLRKHNAGCARCQLSGSKDRSGQAPSPHARIVRNPCRSVGRRPGARDWIWGAFLVNLGRTWDCNLATLHHLTDSHETDVRHDKQTISRKSKLEKKTIERKTTNHNLIEFSC